MKVPDSWLQKSCKKSNVIDIGPTALQWHLLTSAARFKWKKLSNIELEKTKGSSTGLVELISSRYMISQKQAQTQVDDFFLLIRSR